MYQQFSLKTFPRFFSFSTATLTEGKNLYVSRSVGDDTWSCEQTKPCKTISRAVELASSGDHILLDGTNTDKDPYKILTTVHQERHIIREFTLTRVYL